MQETSSRKPATAAAARHALLLALLAAAFALALHGLVRGLRDRLALEILLAPWFPAWACAAALSVGAGAAALALRLRPRSLRAGEASALSFRVLFAILVLGTAFFVTFLQPLQRLYLDLAAGLAAGLFAAWVALEPAILRAVPRKWLRVADVALFDLALLLVLGELALRVAAAVRPSPLFAMSSRGAQQFLEANRPRAGEVRWGFPFNSRGHYDVEFAPKRPGQTRVVSIGDSFSASGVPHAYHFTTVCERLLPGVEVCNLGVVAIGPPEYLLLLNQEGLALDPDLVVIDVYVGNDIRFFGCDQARGASLLRACFDRQSLYLPTLLPRFLKVGAERRLRGDVAAPVPGPGILPADTEPHIDDLDELQRRMPWISNPLLETPLFSKANFLACAMAHAGEICAGDGSNYGPFFKEMNAIRRAVGSRPLAVMLIPEEFQVEDALWQEVVDGLPHLALDRDLPQRLITAWLEEQGIPYVDLLPRLRAVPPLSDGDRHLYLFRDTHFNVRGNQVAGEGLAELVRKALRRDA
ncbi:MAG TPA: hypothetical protein VMS76_12345 [Planctomycetota bacterium]|nr:hypothetical protein [Planctomycetota bacterium]